MRLEGLWRNPDFLKLWAGESISQIGSWITMVGLPLTAVLLLKATPFEMGILSGAGAATILVFGLFAGAWADRVRRRPILIGADLGRAVVLATIPWAAAMHRLSMTQLYVASALTALLSVLFDVSYQAYLPSLVSAENILEGNSKLALSSSIAGIIGPGLTGVLVQAITAPIAILFDALSFVGSALSLSWIRKPEARPQRASAPHIGREILEGLRASWQEPVLRAILLRRASAFLFVGFTSSLYFLLAIRELKLTAILLSIVIAVGGVSDTFGALFAERLVRRFGVGHTLIGTAAIIGVANLLLPLARGPVWVCAGILAVAQLGDMAWSIYTINELSLRQAITPGHLMGRVNSAMHLVFRGVMPLGSLAGGALAEAAGIRTALFAGAVGVLLSTLWLVFSPVRHIRDLPAPLAATVS
jgi:predicted MFS family arabinose efflux permease